MLFQRYDVSEEHFARLDTLSRSYDICLLQLIHNAPSTIVSDGEFTLNQRS